jgi:carboxyl-terminal processing protease
MDLLDDPKSRPPTAPESFMRRFRKILALAGACALALFLTIQHRGEDIRLATNAPLSAAVRTSSASYDLSLLPVFSKALYFVNNNYFDKTRLDPRRMLVGALDFLQRDVPEILVDRYPERDPKQVTVKVNGQQKTFSIERVEAPWSLRTTLQEIFRFVQPNLQPVAAKDEARRLVEIEMTATNGMLYTLDPHSILLDVESFKDMRTTTQGKFGGLGIIIEMDRKARIVVKKPMPETPASRAGIKAKDHIVRINNESTMNMTLQEAVDRLRGDPGAPVDVYIERSADKGPTVAREGDKTAGMRKFTIVRDFIRPPAIDPAPRVLTAPATPGQAAAKIGYFRIVSFSANTESDLAKALTLFEQEKVKGIIMDLRENPGGLYDQAQKVADAFIESGVLVSMVGVGGAQQKDEHATKNNEPKVPLAVLVNQRSASASEIVAGAIKNLNRGVVIGETSFGKGSVQMLFDISSPVPFGGRTDDDKLGLKLTTAQYLTPGGISIQGVGVTPDIELVRLLVDKKQDEALIHLQTSSRRRQESDYEWHLDHPSARKGGKPSEVISYLYLPPPGQPVRSADDDDEAAADDVEQEDVAVDENRTDFQIDFARDLLAQAKSQKRLELVAASKAFFDKTRADEEKKVSAALEKLGVDWSPGPAVAGGGQLQVSLAPVGGDGKVAAGNSARVRGTVKNLGNTTVYRARAVLKSDNMMFDENEMVFGKVPPGGSKTYELTVKVPKNSLTRTDTIRAEVMAQGTIKANPAEMMLNIEGKQRPQFAYTYQTIDDVGGNRDGQVQPGEKVRLLVKVKNIGRGAALKTEAILRNGPGQEGILISAGRFDAKELAPGATKPFSFVYEVGPDFKGEDFQLELMVGDTVLGESVTDKIKVKVAGTGPVAQADSGTVSVAKPEALLREAPVDGALIVGRAAKGAGFKATGKVGTFTRVEIEPNHPAFVANTDVQVGGSAQGSYKPEWQVTPPLLAIIAPTVVSGTQVHIKGVATDEREVKDIYVRVWNRDSKMPPKKVFYLPNRGDKKRLTFETDVPLWPGSNMVQVFARETNEVQSVQTVIVLDRVGASFVQQTRPEKEPDPKNPVLR